MQSIHILFCHVYIERKSTWIFVPKMTQKWNKISFGNFEKIFWIFAPKMDFFANWNNSIKVIVFIILSNFLLLEPNLLKATIVFWIHGILFYKKSWVCSSVSNYFHDGVVVTWTTTRHHILLVISLSIEFLPTLFFTMARSM